jgi:HEAT repeat protein
MADIVNSTDWTNPRVSGNYYRIARLISDQERHEEFFNLLASDDAFTVVNTAELIRLLDNSGLLLDPQKSITISALSRVIAGSDSEFKFKAIMVLNNTADDYIFSYLQNRVLEERLTDDNIALINEIVDSLILALNDESNQIKYYAAYSIHYYGLYAGYAEPELIKLLENEQIEVRLSATGTIGHINPNTSVDVIPIILEGLRNYDRNTLRISAIEALVKIGDSNKCRFRV